MFSFSLKASNPAPPSFMKGFVDKRNAEILQRDLEQKRKAQSDLNTTPEHRVEALRPHRHSGHALPSPVSKVGLVEMFDEPIQQISVKDVIFTNTKTSSAESS